MLIFFQDEIIEFYPLVHFKFSFLSLFYHWGLKVYSFRQDAIWFKNFLNFFLLIRVRWEFAGIQCTDNLLVYYTGKVLMNFQFLNCAFLVIIVILNIFMCNIAFHFFSSSKTISFGWIWILKWLILGTAPYWSVQNSGHFYWLFCKKVCLTSCRHLSKAILGTLPVLKQKNTVNLQSRFQKDFLMEKILPNGYRFLPFLLLDRSFVICFDFLI